MGKNVHGFDLMQNLPKKLIKNLKEQFTFWFPNWSGGNQSGWNR